MEHLKGRVSRSSLPLFTPQSHLPPPACPFPRSCPAAVLRLSMSSHPTNAHHSLSPVRPSRAALPQAERFAPQPHAESVHRRPAAHYRLPGKRSGILRPGSFGRAPGMAAGIPLSTRPRAPDPAETHSPPQAPAPRPVPRRASVSPVTS